MEPSRIRVTFLHSGESVVATPAGTYEHVGGDVVIKHEDGTTIARLSREQVQVSAARAEAGPTRVIHIRRAPDGSWTAHPQPPLAATSTFVTDGWAQVARLREQFHAVEHFESSDYRLFVREFGEPPDPPRA